MDHVHLRYVDNVHVKVDAEPGVLREISDNFTYYAPNYKFHPKFRARQWDGKIRLLHSTSQLIYAGLAKRIKKFCDSRGYSFTFDDELIYEEVSENEIREHIKSLKIPEEYKDRDYQFESVVKCIRTGRRTLLSP